MMKKIVTLAIAAIVLAGSSAMAQNTQNGKKDKQCAATECPAQAKKCGKGCMMEKEFAGITLTDAQKEKIKDIKMQFKKECQALKAEAQTAEANGEKVAKEAKKDGDKALKEGRRAEMKAKKAEYFQKIKEVLTPEQYVVYLENAAMADHGPKGKMHKGMKDHKDNKDLKEGRPSKKMCSEKNEASK